MARRRPEVAPPAYSVVAPIFGQEDEESGQQQQQQRSDVRLTVTYDVQDSQTLVRVQCNDFADPETDRAPADICLVIDKSSSMQAELRLGGQETGYTRLAMLKNAANLVINACQSRDILSIVAFDTNAFVCLPRTRMTSEGKRAARAALKPLTPGGTTNLKDGTLLGLQQIQQETPAGTKSHVIVFTDGEPDSMLGTIGVLQSDRAAKPRRNAMLHTVAVGYDQMQSIHLHDIAAIHDGKFAYICDAGIVVTVMASIVSAIFATAAVDLKVAVGAFGADSEFESVRSQTLPLVLAGSVNLFAFDNNSIGPGEVYVTCDGRRLPANMAEHRSLQRITTVMKARTAFMQLLGEIALCAEPMHEPTFAHRLNEFHHLYLPPHIAAHDPVLDSMGRDLRGEMQLALKPGNWQKWGRHHAVSLYDAHLRRLRHNSKDPGVQAYATPTFTSFRTTLDELVMQQPQQQQQEVLGANDIMPAAASSRSSGPVSVASLNNDDNPCFAGDCIVETHVRGEYTLVGDHGYCMPTFEPKRVQDLRAGDEVRIDNTSSWRTAKVKCVVETQIGDDRPVKMVRLMAHSHPRTGEPLLITPWHPVCIDGEWVFPCNVPDVQIVEMRNFCLISVVLEEQVRIVVNGIVCVTLGPSPPSSNDSDGRLCNNGDTLLQSADAANPIINHPFWAHQAVTQLQQLDPVGWARGRIVFAQNPMLRATVQEEGNAEVQGFDPSKLISCAWSMSSAWMT